MAWLIVSVSMRADEANPTSSPALLKYVNILQGVDSTRGLSHGNTLPLVGMPWGMTDWTIQDPKAFLNPKGKVSGFRATHEPSPWMGDYGQFVLMPQSGVLAMDTKSRASEYDASSLVLEPDYERVDFTKYRVTSELTPTERCAVFRLTYHQGDTGRLLFNASGGSEIQIEGRTIRGSSRITHITHGVGPGNSSHFFVIELDREITKNDTFINNIATGASSATGNNAAGYVEFKITPNVPVEVRVGTSFISWEQAEQNLQSETSRGFDAARSLAHKTWNDSLGAISIDASEAQKRTFYSCLYRAQMFPRRLYELNSAGKPIHHSPYDGKIHEGVLYGDIGIWDAFRTTFPLITILYPSQVAEILQGFLNASKEGGSLPEWPSPGYRDCMIGEHCAAIFADAVVKGITGFDVASAYQSLKKSAFEPPAHGVLVRRGLGDYMKLGYIPNGASTYALSATLDYAYDDWCVAQIAKQQHEPDVYQSLMKRSQNYRFLWDPKVGFMRPKNADGQWVEPFDEFAWGGSYAESGPWQSSWFVPHDPAGLIGLIGGPEKMTAKLDAMLAIPPTFHVGGYGHVIHEMTEMAAAHFGQYAQSNQPSFDNLYLFTAAGQPWKTEYWTRRVCAEMFDSSPRGFPGDEDNGSMASWFILSSVGLYPFCPGTSTYLFTSPQFSKVTLHLPRDREFVITAPTNSDKNVYVQSRTLNGSDYTQTGIPYSEIMQGGVVNMEMGPEAKTRSVEAHDLPYSATPYK